MGAYDRIKSALQTVATEAGGLLRLVLGDPADGTMEYPTGEEWEKFKLTWSIGELWDPNNPVMATILQKIGAEIDDVIDDLVVWAHISTNGTGVTPTVNKGRGVASAGKSEIDSPQTLTVTLSSSFDSAQWFAVAFLTGAQPSIPEISAIAAGSATFSFQKHDGSYYGVNSQTVIFLGIGIPS